VYIGWAQSTTYGVEIDKMDRQKLGVHMSPEVDLRVIMNSMNPEIDLRVVMNSMSPKVDL
jgi:hypothetical protein